MDHQESKAHEAVVKFTMDTFKNMSVNGLDPTVAAILTQTIVVSSTLLRIEERIPRQNYNIDNILDYLSEDSPK